MKALDDIGSERPVLIAGPTASGKSALALELATRQGGVIVNADALQVFANWRILTARPGPEEEAMAPHALYGHVAGDVAYSVGHWLRDVAPFLAGDERPIIVGGTGLYFAALTEGLAEIPPTPPDIRELADRRLTERGAQSLLSDLDAETAQRIDTLNPARIQRAWEVQRTTGRGLAEWHDRTPAPLLPLDRTEAIVIDADRDWLADRITRRFDTMMAAGALEEARRNLDLWDRTLPSAKAIGANELIRHLKSEIPLSAARQLAIVATRQYAKRQRTWFRGRMGRWSRVVAPA